MTVGALASLTVCGQDALHLHELLRNRYWRGVEYEGKHPVFISSETLEHNLTTLVVHELVSVVENLVPAHFLP